jgi:hypothetical protein
MLNLTKIALSLAIGVAAVSSALASSKHPARHQMAAEQQYMGGSAYGYANGRMNHGRLWHGNVGNDRDWNSNGPIHNGSTGSYNEPPDR